MDQTTIVVDPRVYRLSAVKKAAYRLGDRCYADIEVAADESIRVRLAAKRDGVCLRTLEGDFRNELLDQELRESIAEETERVRNLLLAQAFSGVSLTDAAGESADFRDDPLGISRPQAKGH
jgi:His-Xaa-Ser system protein HxsD